MSTRHGTRTRGLALAEVSEGAKCCWIFRFVCGAVPRFAVTVRHGTRSVTWPDIDRTIVDAGDLDALPEGIAAWVTQLTGGVMPARVADAAAVRIGRWLALNADRLARAADAPVRLRPRPRRP